MARWCYKCHTEIPAERLEILPDTETCMSCSRVKPVVGIVQGGGSMSSSTKESQLVIMSGDKSLLEHSLIVVREEVGAKAWAEVTFQVHLQTFKEELQ